MEMNLVARYVPARVAIALCLFLMALCACRKDTEPLPPEVITDFPANPDARITGFYLLNEGNMNMNKASLDYFDYTTGAYRKNIFSTVNPGVTLGLGDVGNDIGAYGNKLYVVVNVSNKIEVLDAATAKRIKLIELANCRYVAFHEGKAYVSAYLGAVGDPNAPNGVVAEIDTATLEISRRVEVGRQPEEMVIANNKLYVANSGGYNPTNYEHTISVVDLTTFTEEKRIPVAINLHRMKRDSYGDIYVSSRGDYFDTPSRLCVIDTQTDHLKHTFDLPVSNLVISGDTAYVYSTAFSYETGETTVSYGLVDVKNEKILAGSFIKDGSEVDIKIPYGIAVNPETKEILVTDARDYVSPGRLHCYGLDGKLKWSVTTGDIPAHIAFTQ